MIQSVRIFVKGREQYQWCDHCKKKCNTEEHLPYLLTSTNEDMPNMVLCKACLDLALSEQGILPEEF